MRVRVVINTNYNSAGTRVCVDDLSIKFKNIGFEVIKNDWENYQNYDLILFMSPDSNVEKAKKINNKALVGIMDPKITRKRKKEVELADFLLVSSIEQRDFFLRHNKNIFIYFMFPEMKEISREHVKKDKIIIGYHGNKTHLNSLKEISQALDQLSGKYSIEFWAMYNIEKLGKWKFNLPQRCPIKHIQWSEDYNDFNRVDIGIVPAQIPINKKLALFFTRKIMSFLGINFGLSKYDYLLRFKYSTNPGRIYIFSQLGIPVVADFFPSACQIIQDGHSGFLVYSKEGWYDALEKLITSPELRNKMSRNLRDFINNNCSPDINFNNFLEFLKSLKK